MDQREARARDIQASIRQILRRDWDPIHVQDVPEAQDEYDSYVGPVYRLLTTEASADTIAEYLARVASEEMGITTSPNALRPVARKLKQLDVRLAPA